MTARRLTAVLATTLSVSGCAAEAPTQTPVSTPDTVVAASTPAGVTSLARPPAPEQAEPVDPATLTDLVVTLPQPAGWERADNQLAPHAQLIVKNDSYPNASLVVYRVHGHIDATELIRQARTAGTPPGFTALHQSAADFHDFRSEVYEGNFTAPDGHRVHTYHRVVVPVTPANQRYLVDLTVSSLTDQTMPEADDIAQVINEFDIRVK